MQIVFKHNPAPDDPKARLGARGRGRSRAAGQVLGDARPVAANPAKLEREHLAGYAKTLGLDVAAFAEALRRGRTVPSSSATSLEAGHRRRPGRWRCSSTAGAATACRRPPCSRPHQEPAGRRRRSGPAPVTAGDPRPDRIAGPRRRRRAGHHRRVLRLPVRVLLPRQPDADAAARPLPGKVRVGLQAQPDRGPHRRAAGPPRRLRRAAAGQVLGDARPHLRQPARRWSARRCSPTRRRSGSTSARFTADLDSPRVQAVLDRDLAEGAKARCRRHADVLRQRHAAGRARSRSRRSPPPIDKALAARPAAR